MKKRISLSLLPLIAASALAQDAVDEEEVPEIRRYTVEMIIFAYEQNVATGSEIFVPDEPPPVDPLLDDEILGPLNSIPDSVAEIIEIEEDILEEEVRKYELVMLAEEDFTLLDAMERLDRLDAYTPLLHFGWTQPTYPEEDTEFRPLSSFITPPEGLEGDLKLYLSRYLHLALDLQLDAPVDEAAFNPNPLESYPVRFRIDEDRIFRNGELRYFDHPKFGVLAKISRVEEEPAEEEMLGESEFLGFDGE